MMSLKCSFIDLLILNMMPKTIYPSISYEFALTVAVKFIHDDNVISSHYVKGRNLHISRCLYLTVNLWHKGFRFSVI